jgi:MerR family transcriptional regulator, thiopeptide resistance regulator
VVLPRPAREHLAHVDQQLAAIRALGRRLVTMVAAVQAVGPPRSADLLVLMEEVRKVDDTMKRYFTEDQVAA